MSLASAFRKLGPLTALKITYVPNMCHSYYLSLENNFAFDIHADIEATCSCVGIQGMLKKVNVTASAATEARKAVHTIQLCACKEGKGL